MLMKRTSVYEITLVYLEKKKRKRERKSHYLPHLPFLPQTPKFTFSHDKIIKFKKKNLWKYRSDSNHLELYRVFFSFVVVNVIYLLCFFSFVTLRFIEFY